jgi:DHA1 family tetracycline resistance protein-like MFS transporter
MKDEGTMKAVGWPGRSAAGFVLATLMIDSMGVGLIMPVVPTLIMTLAHTDLADATRVGGELTFAYAFAMLLAGPLVGNLGDRFGRRIVLLAALAGLASDYLLLSFAPNLAWLFVGRLLAGLFGATGGPAGAALADLSPPEERAHAFGLMAAAYGFGLILGPTMGGLLGELGPRTPFYAAAALSALNLMFGIFVFPETLDPKNRRPLEWSRANPLGAWRSLGQLGGVKPLLIASFFWQLASMIYPVSWAYFTVAAFGWTPRTIGLSLALCGVLM